MEDDGEFERFVELARRAHEDAVLGELEHSVTQTASDACPPPLTGHPYYQGRQIITDWLNGTSSLPEWDIMIPKPRRMDLAAFDAESEPIAIGMDVLTMTKQRAWGGAPWTGRPFHYEWYVGTDNLGRRVAGESRIVYETGLRLWRALGEMP